MPPFFSEILTAITIIFKRMISANVTIVKLLFLPLLNKMQYTVLPKFLPSTSKHITNGVREL
jgi:hypothetical protein